VTTPESAAYADLGRILVVIPTYNEAANVAMIVGRVRDAVPEAHVLVVDDNSPDGTGAIAAKLAESDDHVHLRERAGKEGLGAAYLDAFAWGLDAGYDVLVEMDADGSHQPEQLPRLLTALRDADLVLGSRWVPGGAVENWPLSRKILSLGGNLYARLALGIPIRDATGGYRAFRATTLEKLDMADVASAGYCFQVDLLWRALRRGMRVVEVPITFVERTAGVSKMSKEIVREAYVKLTQWGIQHRVSQLRRLTGRLTADRATGGRA
jgi:dolichol-phosphate mannosyltransferase